MHVLPEHSLFSISLLLLVALCGESLWCSREPGLPAQLPSQCSLKCLGPDPAMPAGTGFCLCQHWGCITLFFSLSAFTHPLLVCLRNNRIMLGFEAQLLLDRHKNTGKVTLTATDSALMCAVPHIICGDRPEGCRDGILNDTTIHFCPLQTLH